MSSTKKLTKADALAAIERNDAANAELRAFIESLDVKPTTDIPPIAVRFSTENGETGVILRFPTDATIAAYAEELNVTENQLRAMKVTEFMTRLFIARGGQVYNAEYRIEEWNKLRWPLDGTPLWRLTEGMSSMDDLKKIYKKLRDQPAVVDLIGHVEVKFMSLKQNLDDAGTFWQHMAEKRLLPDPLHMLGLLLSLKDPSDASTYPSTIGWERVGALNADGCVAGLYAYGGDVSLDWRDPACSNVSARVPASQ